MTSIPSIRHCKVPRSSPNTECLQEENWKLSTLPHTPCHRSSPHQNTWLGKTETLSWVLLCLKWKCLPGLGCVSYGTTCRWTLKLTLEVLEYG